MNFSTPLLLATLTMANASELLDQPAIVQSLALQEGLSEVPYRDTRGFLTIGYGHRIHESWNPESTIDHGAALAMLKEDIAKAEAGCRRIYGAMFDLHPEPVRHALIHMAFQLGTKGLSEFKHMKTYIDRGDYVKAAAEALHSKWAMEQTPERARFVTELMAKGARR